MNRLPERKGEYAFLCLAISFKSIKSTYFCILLLIYYCFCVVFKLFQVTRNVLRAFRRMGFENPIESARKFLNVVFVVRVCPPLQARLSLSQPRAISKRRRSTAFPYAPRKPKNRRLSCATSGSINNFLFKKN